MQYWNSFTVLKLFAFWLIQGNRVTELSRKISCFIGANLTDVRTYSSSSVMRPAQGLVCTSLHLLSFFREPTWDQQNDQHEMQQMLLDYVQLLLMCLDVSVVLSTYRTSFFILICFITYRIQKFDHSVSKLNPFSTSYFGLFLVVGETRCHPARSQIWSMALQVSETWFPVLPLLPCSGP